MVADPITVSPDATISTAAKIIRDKRIGCLIVTEGEEMVGILSYLDVLDAAERESKTPAAKQQDLDDTQPMNMAELSDLRQQMAAELSEFRASTPNPKASTVDLRAREARLAEQESRRSAREKERADDESPGEDSAHLGFVDVEGCHDRCGERTNQQLVGLVQQHEDEKDGDNEPAVA